MRLLETGGSTLVSGIQVANRDTCVAEPELEGGQVKGHERREGGRGQILGGVVCLDKGFGFYSKFGEKYSCVFQQGVIFFSFLAFKIHNSVSSISS